MCVEHRKLATAGKVRREGKERSQIKDIIDCSRGELLLPETPTGAIVSLISALLPQDQIYRAATENSALAKDYIKWQRAVTEHLAKILHVEATLDATKTALVKNGFDLKTTLSFLQ